MDLPGMKPEQVQIEFKDDQLIVSGERTVTRHEGAKAWREERASGKFHRVIQLPETANHDSVDAVYDAGVLTIVVAKVPKPAPRQITIRTLGPSVSQTTNE